MRMVLFQFGPFTIYGYGLMIALGVFAAFAISVRRAGQNGLDPDRMFNLGIVGIIGGLVGAKLLYYVTELPAILEEPARLFRLNEGFVVYGGLIGGFVSPYVYARIRHLPFWRYLDLAVVGVAVAQGFGRIGCFLAGCCYGRETQAFFGVVFPEGSLAPAGIPLIPTQILSCAGDFAIAGILLFSGRYLRKRPSAVSGLYLILYSAGRFLVEFLRDDPRGTVGVLSTSQFIAIFMLAAGIFIMLRSKRSRDVAEGEEKQRETLL